MKVEAVPFAAQDDDGMATHLSHRLIRCVPLPPDILVHHAGGFGAVVDKVKDALGIEDETVDENILEYCSLDKAVSVQRWPVSVSDEVTVLL